MDIRSAEPAEPADRPGIRTAEPADHPGIRAVCEVSLSLESDAADLPGLLLGDDDAGTRVALVAESDGAIVGVACGSLRPGAAGAGAADASVGPARGCLDLLAVVPPARRRGLGGALLGAVERELATRGAAEFRIAGNAPLYLWPGVDRRYTAMVALAEKAGYQRDGEAVNMAVDLNPAVDLTAGPPGHDRLGADRLTAGSAGHDQLSTDRLGVDLLSTGADVRRLSAGGITVRRASAGEAGPLIGWLRQGPWGESAWPDEVARSLDRDPPGCHIAERAGHYLAFACHGVNRRGWFGPMGTLDAERRQGIGAVLLKRCLTDIRDSGLASAQIGWTGPVQFYVDAVGARPDREFWLYRKGG